MEIYYWYDTGKACHGMSDVIRSKSAATNALRLILDGTTGHFYKVGITGMPAQRKYGHRKVIVARGEDDANIYETGLWRTMHVILQSETAFEIRRAESALIDFAMERYGGKDIKDQKVGQSLFTFNERGGGGGRLRAKGPYFLYVLRSGKFQPLSSMGQQPVRVV